MRRSQIHAQVLVYILAMIIMALILAYGYNAIKDILNKGEFTSLVKFKTELKTSITSISHDYGSVKNEEFIVPTGFQEVCFVDLSKITAVLAGREIDSYPIVKNYINSIEGENAEPKNVFLIPPGTESDYVGNISVDGGFLCFDASQGRIRVRLEGLGNRAKISSVT
ncbi:hypothetical protein A3K72_03025 [Candidatus Woesearchaeota archaeon RBG_13_36_6]|nr:MAG: hypothetical protein A3K72_03025 [Candidatus Woesearchaeota archaeon RBG_13_36_6]